MSVRSAFLLLVVPLFLLLAAVNGALLYGWERAAAEQGLKDEAVSAAVTAAAFAAGADDLAATLADPRREAALTRAAANVRGLDGLYLGRTGARPTRLAGASEDGDPGRFAAPAAPTALPIRTGPAGNRVITALAPASGGRFVVAQIDAEPLFRQVAGLRRLILALVAVAGVVGLALALWIAGRIRGELARNSRLVETIRTGAPLPDDHGWALRETRDLASAVRLMKTSVEGRLARSERELAMRDRRRDATAVVADFREAAFPPLEARVAGADVAARRLGAAAPGAFYALAQADGRAGLVVGECEGETPVDALARALAARGFLERRLLESDPEARIAEARAAFALKAVAWRTWTAEAPPAAGLALLDGDAGPRAEAYVAGARTITPAQALADLEPLLAANGVAAVVRPASGDGGQG